MRAPLRGRAGFIAAIGSAAAVTLSFLSAHAVAAQPQATGRSLTAGSVTCPAAVTQGNASCQATLDGVAAGHSAAASSAVPGFTPASLRSAYNLTKASAVGGGTATVAIVTAFGDPTAASDLATYRSHFKLGACAVTTGCLTIINEFGNTKNLPPANSAWAANDAIALDVISGLCPKCHLLLVEAKGTLLSDLGAAENLAVAQGAKFIDNGWSGTDGVDENGFAHFFDHPGVAVVFAAGTSGYGSVFPASLPFVTSVGGTTLKRSSFNSRGWGELAWADSSSGCASLQVKPSWQRGDAQAGTGCLNRTENDVAADADPATGAAVFDTTGATGWHSGGNTSLAAAIISATYALAGTPAADTYPASYPYQHVKSLFDVQFGTGVGECEIGRQYLCNAMPKFDGPTGLGTPDGTAAFSAAGSSAVTVMDPGTQDEEEGTSAVIKVTALDSRHGARLSYTAAGLPAGLSIAPLPNSAGAEITGTLPATVASYSVVVTGTDAKTGQSGSTHFSIVSAGSLAADAPVTASITTDTNFTFPPAEGNCLDAGADTAGTVVGVSNCTGVVEQLWTHQPEGFPGGPAQLTSNGGLCLGLASGSLVLQACDPVNADQGWVLLFAGTFKNAGTGTCVATTDAADPLVMSACNANRGSQQWTLVGARLRSAVPGMCLVTDDDGFHTSPYVIEPCAAPTGTLTFGFDLNGNVQSSLFRCMIGSGRRLDGTVVNSGSCSANQGPAEDWLEGPGGELINEGSGLCLDDPGNSKTAGTELILNDCYGSLGEIWAIS